ncbi:MAG: ATP-binding protein [Pseudomonadota bacterium]
MSALFIIASLAYVIAYTSQIRNEAVKYGKWVDHSREVLIITENIVGTFESTLAEQRGYLLTADKDFEARFQVKSKDLVTALNKLLLLTKDNFEQLSRVQQMQDLAVTYGRLLNERSQKYSRLKGGGSVLRFSAEYYAGLRKTRAVHDTFIKTTDQFLNTEHHILSDRLGRFNDQRRKFSRHFVISLFGACILIILSNWVVLASQRKWLLERTRFQNIDDRYRIAVRATNDGIFDWDIPGKRIFLSSQVFKMCGYDLKDYEGSLAALIIFTWGKNPLDLIHPDDIGRFKSCLKLFENGEVTEYNNTFRVKHAHGHWVWIHARGSGLFNEADGDQKPIRLIGSHTDITASKLMEERLRAEKEAADNSSKMKMEFLSHMSHEIRTPLTTINGAAEILMRSAHNFAEREQSIIRTLNASTGMLRELINDILDFSRIENGEFGLTCEPMSIHNLFEQVIIILSGQAQEKNLSFQSRHHNLSDIIFDGDEARIRQILLNLAGNAIKFTDIGGVTIVPSIKLMDNLQAEYQLHIDVIDTGIGISEKDLTHIFDRFYQADGTISKKYQGTGLGLAISRGLAEAMGGRIEAISTPGTGSTFTFVLPIRILNPDVLHEIDAALAAPLVQTPIPEDNVPVKKGSPRLLLVEDYEGNVLVITCMLEDMGYKCDVAGNGQQAVEKAAKVRYDAILMDIQMPIMDGLSATVQIRKAEAAKRKRGVPIIGMTAHATQMDKEKCLAAGMDSYISKPIDRPRFEQIIKEFVSK